MNSTKLSTLISRMDRWQSIYTIEEQYKVRDLDDAIRNLTRDTQLPWSLKKGTLRVFDDVLEYPVASDHNYLAYLDSSNLSNNKSISEPARFFFTSLKEFYENKDYRNDLAEIWDNGTKYLGVRYENFSFGSSTVDTSDTASDYTASGDAGTPVLDQVFFKVGNSSIKIPVTSSSGVATIINTPGASYDSNYKRKYYFRYVYLDSAPTSIELRFGTDSSNYLRKVVTTQFSGQAFKADDWNLVAFDLNAPDSTVGTIGTSSFNYEAAILNGAATGNYYINQSYLREWTLMDYWYYSTYNIKTVSASVPDQDYFYNSSESYSTDSELVGDEEWADVVMYDAILLGLTDKENMPIIRKIEERRAGAYQKLLDNYPSEKPLITNRKYNFETDYSTPNIL